MLEAGLGCCGVMEGLPPATRRMRTILRRMALQAPFAQRLPRRTTLMKQTETLTRHAAEWTAARRKILPRAEIRHANQRGFLRAEQGAERLRA